MASWLSSLAGATEGFRTIHKPCRGRGGCRHCTSPHGGLTSPGPQKKEGRGMVLCSVFPFCFLKRLEEAFDSLPSPNDFPGGFFTQEKKKNKQKLFPYMYRMTFTCQIFQKNSSGSYFWILPPWHCSTPRVPLEVMTLK